METTNSVRSETIDFDLKSERWHSGVCPHSGHTRGHRWSCIAATQLSWKVVPNTKTPQAAVDTTYQKAGTLNANLQNPNQEAKLW